MSTLSIGAWFGIMCCSAEGAVMIGRGLWFLYGNSSVTSENCGLVGLCSGKLWYTVE